LEGIVYWGGCVFYCGGKRLFYVFLRGYEALLNKVFGACEGY
jgi:hypothetical protein